MRADMGKVLVERPRITGWGFSPGPAKGYRKRLQKCLDSGESPPVREGIKRRYGHATKHFNEHLGPLRRFLDSNIGRQWNKVYAEICKHVDRNNVVQKHILTHLFEYVVVNTVLIDGEPCRGEAYGRSYGQPLRKSDRYHQWYVCPKSGLLRKSKYIPHKCKKLEPPRHLKLNNKQLCVFRNERWELITVTLLDQPFSMVAPDYGGILADELQGHGVFKPKTTLFNGGNKYEISRQHLSRKELRSLPIPIEWLA